ncbi:FtsX-like permease family protein [Brachybacterium sp. DNPG3]
MLPRLAVAGLRRDLTATVVLGILMIASVMLAATGAGLLTRLAGSSDRLLDHADAPDLAQMHTGELDDAQGAALRAFVDERPGILAHQVSDLVTLDGSSLLFDGVSQADSLQQNSLTVPTPERDRLLTVDGDVLAAVEPGTVWMPVLYAVEDGLAVGDTVTVSAPDGFRLSLEVAGFVRDSLMSTAFASSKRLAVNPQDLQAVAARTGTREHLISFWIDEDVLTAAALSAQYAERAETTGGEAETTGADAGESAGTSAGVALPANGPMLDRGAFRLFMMIGEGLVAGAMILIAVLVAAVGALCLRLGVLTVLERDRPETGVLRAIGVPDGAVARLHLLRIALVCVPAGLLGLLGALQLEPVLGARLTRFTGESASAPVVLAAAATSLLMVAATLGTTALLLHRLRRGSPASLLRTGGTAPRRARRVRPRTRRPLLARRGVPASAVLAVRGIRRSIDRSMLLVGVFALCTMLVVIPSAIATTLASPRMLTSLGIGPVDILVQSAAAEDAEDRFAALREELAEDPDVRETRSDRIMRRQMVTAVGERIAMPVTEGERGALDSEYAEGRAPTVEGEIALSLLALAETGTSVGDTLTMVRGGDAGTAVEVEIVGAYQDLTDGGVTARIQAEPTGAHAAQGEAEMVMRHTIGIVVAPGVDAATFARELAEAHPGLEIAETEEYRDQLLGSLAEQMTGASRIALLAATALAALMSAMVLRLEIAAGRASIAVQRDLGLGDGLVMKRFTLQMLIVLALGIVVGAAAGEAMGQGLLNLALEASLAGPSGMLQGASRIRLEGITATTAALLPALMVAVVGATSVLTVVAALRAADRNRRREGAEG